MDFIAEKARETKVYGEYDVVVVGGGVAGVSAALAAKRKGAKKVLLIEKQFALGGLATLGIIPAIVAAIFPQIVIIIIGLFIIYTAVDRRKKYY